MGPRRLAAIVLLLGAVATLGCRRYPPTLPPPDAEPPETAPIEDAPTIRPSPTPPGRQSEVPGPPHAVAP